MNVGDTNGGNRGGSGWQSAEHLTRDESLGRLMQEACQPADAGRGPLSWDRIELLIDSAPPVSVSWQTRLIHGGARPLRYALAGMMLLALGTGVMAVVPAQSDIAGTVVLTDLPSAWSAGSPEVADFEGGAQELFAQSAPEQAELCILDVQEHNGRPSLALSMLHVEPAQAEAIFSTLSERYPALAAFEPRFVPVASWQPGSLLNQAFLKLTRPGELSGLSDNELRVRVLQALGQVGLEAQSIEVRRQADGSVLIEVDAAMNIAVEGHTQEELNAAGLSQDTLGEQAYGRLLQELEAGK